MNIPGWISGNVSRETLDALESYVSLIEKWNPRINLVSKSSLNTIWDRHIWDSAQIANFPVQGNIWTDLGSGGGLPGIVMAILAKDLQPEMRFNLIESDQRKSAFLRNCIRELNLNAEVFTNRIEKQTRLESDVISARALADLNVLLEFTEQHLVKTGVAIFPKGETWEKELRKAEELWSFECEIITSKTNANAAVLKIKDLARV